MNREIIIRFWKIAYIKLFDDYGSEEIKKYRYFKDNTGDWECNHIFWRFYWCSKEN